MSIDKDRLEEILSHVAAKCGMKNWCYKTEETSEIIETYFGVLIPLTLIGVSEDEEIFQHVYIKLPNTDKSLRIFSEFIWNAESYFYSTFLPLWQRIPNVKIDELIPQCYYADATPNHQAIVLKNMRYEGFQIYKERFLDFEHVIVSLKSLAQFHAQILIIKKDHEGLKSNVFRPYTDVYPLQLNEAILNCFRAHSKLFNGTKYERYWDETLENYKTLVAESTSKAKCLVYGHGDYSKENIMFKYEVKNPLKACILDFQACRLMSPAYDFLFFILNSTNGTLRRLHYHHFLTEYYTTLKNTLSCYGYDLECLYKKEDFISDLKIVASVCFIRICLAFSLWLGFESKALIKSKNLWENDQQRDKELRYFKEILIDAMEDLCNYGYITL